MPYPTEAPLLKLTSTPMRNWTDPCPDTTAWDWVYTLQPAYMAVICVLGAVGNAFVVSVLCLQRKRRASVAEVYLCNLAVADLVLVSCLPFWAVTVAHEFHWHFGTLMCKLVNVAISANYFCSVLSLMLVSIDRYLALARPLTFGRLRGGPGRARRLCLAIWVASLVLSLPTLLFRKVKRIPELDMDACVLDFPHNAWRIQRNVTSNVVGFLVPVTVLAFCTCQVVTSLRQRWNQSRGTRLGVGQEVWPGMEKKRKATRLVMVVFVAFLLCWLPHQLLRFLDTLDQLQVLTGCTWGYILDIGTQMSTYLAYMNSALNPFLYVLMGKNFRSKAKEVFQNVLSNRGERSKSSYTVHLTSTVQHMQSTKHGAGLLNSGSLVLPSLCDPACLLSLVLGFLELGLGFLGIGFVWLGRL
ncbi:hypothetical protein JZ751_010429 [Albula glossodonta]|uniref:B2 bradykinin receptor n=1 Tax=Albula glossodonta TaxID=121402 RepID=A0A8T2P558_9TELE|nr:hypothetical protein JZ751_010429 [Albula glossodonta]